MKLSDLECEGCAARREAIAKWMEAAKAWAKNPLGPPPAPPTAGLRPVTKDPENS